MESSKCKVCGHPKLEHGQYTSGGYRHLYEPMDSNDKEVKSDPKCKVCGHPKLEHGQYTSGGYRHLYEPMDSSTTDNNKLTVKLRYAY